jgi:hypothetical protein
VPRVTDESEDGQFLGVQGDNAFVHEGDFVNLLSLQLEIQTVDVVDVADLNQNLMLITFYFTDQD